jgi:predicted transcriptional regulator
MTIRGGGRTAERGLSRREAQILDILHERGEAPAAEIQARLPDPPGYSSVRKLLEILERKGIVRHTAEGRRFVYAAATPVKSARKSALRHLVRTFFSGSVEQATIALLSLSDEKLDAAALARIARESKRAREEGR